MGDIAGEGNGIGNLVRRAVDMRFDAEFQQRCKKLAVELRDTDGAQRNGARLPVAPPQRQNMIDEIEFDLEIAPTGGDQRRAQPARRDEQRDMPGMIDPWRQRQPRFAHDLRPQLQGRAGLRPRGIRQFGPEVLLLERFWHGDSISRVSKDGEGP
jgi:hypothetical protein